jgi:hypothetical protein
MVARAFVLSVLLFASSAFAETITYTAVLNGPTEGTNSPGVGSATVVIDTTTHIMAVTATFSGLTSPTTASHIHCCTVVPFTGTAGVATMTPSFATFPLGVTAGFMPMTTFLLNSAGTYNPAFVSGPLAGGTVAGAEAALLAGLAAGTTYFNIHTVMFGGGEIRGFLVTPEPSTLSLLGAGLLGMLAGVRLYTRRRIIDS